MADLYADIDAVHAEMAKLTAGGEVMDEKDSAGILKAMRPGSKRGK